MKTIVAIYFLSALMISAGVTPSISKLAKDEKMEVKYESTGCFHNSTYYFVFKADKVIISAPTSKKDDTERYNIGELILSKKDITMLDKLFAYYANGKDKHGSTSIDTISVKLMRGKKVKLNWLFTDGLGGIYGPDKVLTLNELLGRLKK